MQRHPRRFQLGAITRLFRALKNALTGAPSPVPKRKRREEIGSAFRIAARQLMRRARSIPVVAYHRAHQYLAHSLDWLNLWHQHDQDFSADAKTGPHDDLYPHL